jgi:hypothetical protein
MNVDLLTIAGVLAALAVVPWIHIGKGGGRDEGWAPRFTAWMLALSAAAFTLAVPQWRDTLAAFTAGKGGLGVLTVVLFVSGLCFVLQAIHRRKDAGSGGGWRSWFRKKNAPAPALKPRHARHHYNRVYTMVVSAAFGTAAVLAWVRGKQIIAEIAKSPARAQVALGQYSQAVHNGSAVKALTPAQEHHYLFIAAVIIVAGFLLLRGFERKRHGKPFLLPGKKAKSTGGGGGGQRQVGGGGSQRAIGG